MYYRQMCNEKWESVIRCFEIINDGWLVISFVNVPAIKPKPLKPLLQGSGKKNMYDRQRCSESLIPHFNYSKIVRVGWFLI